MSGSIIAFVSALAWASCGNGHRSLKQRRGVMEKRAPPLADSSWPMTHQNIRQTGTSSLPGLSKPSGCSKEKQFDVVVSPGNLEGQEAIEMANTVAMTFEPGDEHFWGATFGATYRAANDKERPEDSNLPSVKCTRALNFEFHGAYAFVNAEGEFFTSFEKTILRYKFRPDIQSADGCQVLTNDTFTVPNLSDGDAIVGMSITPAPSNVVLYATKFGRVGALTQDFELLSEVDLSTYGDISNSIGQDNEGGVYIVTTENILRLNWSPKKGTLTIDWSTPHNSGNLLLPGRLGTGIGSTPSIMIAGSNSYVVVTDGSVPYRLLLFRASDGMVVANETVLFADSNTMTEQSVAVLGNRMLVVNNWIGETFEELGPIFSNQPTTQGLVGYGVAQYEWDEDLQILKRKWINNDISCASSIPTASGAASTPYAYCAGKRGAPVYDVECRGEQLQQPRETLNRDVIQTRCGNWTLEALNWETGESEFHVDLGSELKFNPLFAATQIAADGTMYYGSWGGFVKISNNPSCVAPMPQSLSNTPEQQENYGCTDEQLGTVQKEAAEFDIDAEEAPKSTCKYDPDCCIVMTGTIDQYLNYCFYSDHYSDWNLNSDCEEGGPVELRWLFSDLGATTPIAASS